MRNCANVTSRACCAASSNLGSAWCTAPDDKAALPVSLKPTALGGNVSATQGPTGSVAATALTNTSMRRKCDRCARGCGRDEARARTVRSAPAVS